jgi:hypothetical protein
MVAVEELTVYEKIQDFEAELSDLKTRITCKFTLDSNLLGFNI